MFLFRCKYALQFSQEFIMHMKLKVLYEDDPFDTEMSLQGLLLHLPVFVYLESLHEHPLS